MLAVDQEWKAWLDKNLARRCDPAELYRTMRTHGFTVTTIQALMGDAYPTGIDSTEPPPPMDYQAIANVLAREGAQPPAQRFDTDLLQLYTIPDFLTPEECERVIAIAKASLRPSLVTHSNGDDAFRTSETCDLDRSGDAFVKYIDEKIAQRLGIRVPYSEAIQAQRYSIGQEFKAHHDYFSPYLDVYEKFVGDAGQRTWTFMIYLNDTPKGGGTHFLHLLTTPSTPSKAWQSSGTTFSPMARPTAIPCTTVCRWKQVKKSLLPSGSARMPTGRCFTTDPSEQLPANTLTNGILSPSLFTGWIPTWHHSKTNCSTLA